MVFYAFLTLQTQLFKWSVLFASVLKGSVAFSKRVRDNYTNNNDNHNIYQGTAYVSDTAFIARALSKIIQQHPKEVGSTGRTPYTELGPKISS